MRKISPEVAKHMDNLSNEAGVISALAIDQRGSLKRMLAEAANKPADETTIVDFKEAVSKELTPYASAILTDPEYGLPATKVRDKNCGLLLSYEKTGYDTTEPGRMCDLIADQSALRLKMMVPMQLNSCFTTIQTKVMKLMIRRRLSLKE